MRNFIFFLLFFCCFYSCKNKQIEIPEGLIPRDTLVQIFTELHLMEGLYIHGAINEYDSVKNVEAYRLWIYEKFNIDKKKFEETYDFYIQLPQLLDEMLVEVISGLEKIKDEVQNNYSTSESVQVNPAEELQP
jgi:hypothetical protein